VISDSIGSVLSIAPAFRKPRTIEPAPPLGVTAGLSDDSAIARRGVAIGQYLMDANIGPMLLARVVFRNAIRARHNLRAKSTSVPLSQASTLRIPGRAVDRRDRERARTGATPIASRQGGRTA
jgi:hypothetical protein